LVEVVPALADGSSPAGGWSWATAAKLQATSPTSVRMHSFRFILFSLFGLPEIDWMLCFYRLSRATGVPKLAILRGQSETLMNGTETLLLVRHWDKNRRLELSRQVAEWWWRSVCALGGENQSDSTALSSITRERARGSHKPAVAPGRLTQPEKRTRVCPQGLGRGALRTARPTSRFT
jgi:hypothetical protein